MTIPDPSNRPAGRGWLVLGLLAALALQPLACRSAEPEPEPEPDLERGWLPYPSPRADWGPGTLFRIDRDGVGHFVAELPGTRTILSQESSVPTFTVDGVGLDRLVHFLGGTGAGQAYVADLGGAALGDSERSSETRSRTGSYRLELVGDVRRERVEPATSEDSLEASVRAALGAESSRRDDGAGGRVDRDRSDEDGFVRPPTSDRYSLVRETRSSDEIRWILPEVMVAGLGGPDVLRGLGGVTDLAEKDGELTLSRRFDREMRAVLRADRIRFGDDGIALVRDESFAWLDEVRWPRCERVTVVLHTTVSPKPASWPATIDLLDRDRSIATHRIDDVEFLPGDSFAIDFPLDPPLPLPELRDMNVEVTYEVDPRDTGEPWSIALEAAGTLDDGNRQTFIGKIASRLGAGAGTRFRAIFDITRRPLFRDPRSPMFSAIEVTIETVEEKQRANDVKVSLLAQGRTVGTERATDERWPKGHRRTFHFFLDPPLPYVGLEEMDLVVETQFILAPGSDDRWWMSDGAIGVLTGGDRVKLRRPAKARKLGGEEPTIVRSELR